MSVLIKGMKMPTSCIKGGCPVDALVCELWDSYDKENGWGKLKDPEKMRHPNCPLIELPDHGDLIDRDALNATDSWEWIRHDAPVVIPAERSEEGFDGDTWHDLNGATAAPSGMKWQSNGKSRFSSEYAHRLVKKDTGAEKAEAEAEKLIDKEQRIFLAAMEREREVCKSVDKEYPTREAYKDTLESVCSEITRKVKGALWT